MLPPDVEITKEQSSGQDNAWEFDSVFSSPDRTWTPRHAQTKHTIKTSGASHLPVRPHSPTPRSNQVMKQSPRNNNNVTVVRQAISTPAKTTGFQLLEVPIPHYRLGVPQFNGKGSATIRSSIGSSIASGYDRSSVISSTQQDYDIMFPEPPKFRVETPKPTRQALQKEEGNVLERSDSVRTITQRSPADVREQPQWPLITLTPYVSNPQMPAPPATLQRNSRTVENTGATPTGLMAQITSPSDYIGHSELQHDFFLTFRTYIKPSVLLEYLFARLEWSIRADSAFAQQVKVRVFTAMRYWLMNYFLEDFVIDYELRCQFCEEANNLWHRIKTLSTKEGDFSIREIKRVYRYQLKLYWDMPRSLDPDAVLYPGGKLGSRNPMLGNAVTKEQKDLEAGGFPYRNAPQRRQFQSIPENDPTAELDANTVTTGSVAPDEKVTLRPRHQYRNSDQSVDVAWCAMPKKALRKLSHSKPSAGPQSLGPRPVTPEMLARYPQPQPRSQSQPELQPSQPTVQSRMSQVQAYTPRRPFQSDVSSSSVGGHYGSPSVVNEASPAPTGISVTGSLVRGMGIQPMSPQIVLQPDTYIMRSMAPSFVDPFSNTPTRHRPSDASTRPSILSTMKRALSTRKHSNATIESQRSRNFSRASGRQSATPSRLASSTPVPGSVSEEIPRIDILAAQLLESFEKAMRGENPRDVSAVSAIAEMNMITQKSGTAEVPAVIPEVADDRQSAILSSPQNPDVRQHVDLVKPEPDFLPLDKEIEVEHAPATSPRKRANHRHALSAESTTFSDWSADIRVSQQAGLDRALSEHNSNSTTTDLPIDITSRFNDAPIIEEPAEAIPEPAPANSLYLRNYNTFSYGLSHDSTTQKSLDGDTVGTDVTDTMTDDPFYLERITSPQLKRQPGGDLRAHDHVRSLMIPAHTQSLYSQDSKSHVPSMSSLAAPELSKNINKHSSTFALLTSHSSTQMANMDPEFVAAAANLAALPDEQDDGGIEATLRKLEGRGDMPDFEELTPAQREEALNMFRLSMAEFRPDSAQATQDDIRRHREEEVDGNTITEPPHEQGMAAQESFTTGTTQHHARGASSTRNSIAESMTSYSSTPLIERGAHSLVPHRTISPCPQPEIAEASHSSPRDESYVTAMESELVSSNGADDISPLTHDEESTSGSVIVHDSPEYRRSSNQGSFLLDREQSLRSLQPMPPHIEEAYDDEVGSPALHSPGMQSFYDDADSIHDGEIMPHPFSHPKTPPRLSGTMAREVQIAAKIPAPILSQPETEWKGPRHIPLQERVDFHKQSSHIPLQDRVDQHVQSSAKELRSTSDGTIRAPHAIHAPPPRPLFSSAPNHYPFVLAYDANVLAQQFTLIEKDALSDITWRELVESHWSQTEDPHRNWVDYLHSFSSSPEEIYTKGGIDVCTTRFNLMVQWVTSEILLTQDLQERVACIVKFIQIAVECRKLRNWATCIQLTMALTNSRIQRLGRTWSLVLDHDRQELQTLDMLILPARNFSNIRTEQDRFRVKSDRANEDKKLATGHPSLNGASGIGCIPWMALYTRDLVANAQKPEYLKGAMAVTADGVVLNFPRDEKPYTAGGDQEFEQEKVINVERMRTVASIVRHFVDMKRASEEYVLRQVPELLSRCLWIAALSEEELDRRAKILE